MGYRLKNISNNDFAGSELTYFTLLVVIIGFVISSTVLAHYIGWSEESPYTIADADMYELLMSTEYENMTSYERSEWLDNHYGGVSKWGSFFEIGFDGDFNPFFRYYRYWGDYDNPTHRMTKDEYYDFLSGDFDLTTDIDAWDVLGDIVTLNLPILNNLGVFGIAVKIMIGIFIVFILYLLLPFTG